jgi:hypothetical protein
MKRFLLTQGYSKNRLYEREQTLSIYDSVWRVSKVLKRLSRED